MIKKKQTAFNKIYVVKLSDLFTIYLHIFRNSINIAKLIMRIILAYR